MTRPDLQGRTDADIDRSPEPPASGPCQGDLPAPDPARREGGVRILLAVVIIVAVAAIGVRPAVQAWRNQVDKSYKTRCQAAVQAEDWSELQRIAQAWLERNPHQDDARVFLAEAAIQADDLESAVGLLGAIGDDYPGILESLEIRGAILFANLNRVYEAERTWLRMLDLYPRAAAAHQRLIYFYAMTLQRQTMVAAIRHAMAQQCEPPEAYTYLLLANSLNFSDGLAKVTRWRQAYPDDEALRVAQAVYAAKQTADDSIATFGMASVMPGDQSLLQRCLEEYPSNLEALAAEIEIAVFDGDDRRVAQLMQQAPPDAEGDSRFWRTRGWLLERRGDYQSAADALEHALELMPYEWQSRWLLADVYRKLNRSDEADEMSRIAVQGKDLQRDLFERPNARDLTDDLLTRMLDYIEEVGDQSTHEWLRNRL
jgi:tetratricopeptide (TPR) repeat protein